MIRTYKLPKILIFHCFKYCYQSRYSDNRAWKHVQLNGDIQCNAPLKENKVRDDGDTETSKDLFGFISKITNTVTTLLYM